MTEPEAQDTEGALWLDEEQQRAWRGVVQLFMKLPAALDGDLQRPWKPRCALRSA